MEVVALEGELDNDQRGGEGDRPTGVAVDSLIWVKCVRRSTLYGRSSHRQRRQVVPVCVALGRREHSREPAVQTEQTAFA